MRTSISIIGIVSIAAIAAAVATAGGGLPNIGTPSMSPQPVFKGYYDHHIDTYLLSDASNKGQAHTLHINYSAELGGVKGLPSQYFVKGAAAASQLTVFGSEPGKSNYNPLWEEMWVTWKPGVTPALLGQDDQINALAKEGKLAVTDAHIVLNAPILQVGKSK